MTTLEASIYIEAPWEDVEAVSLQPERLPEWYAGVERVESDGIFPAVGGTITLSYRAAGIPFDTDMTMVEHVEGQYTLYELNGMITGTTRWDVAPEQTGTVLTATFEYEMPGGGLGQIADKLFVEKMNAQNLEKSLKNLAKLVEAERAH